MSDIKINDIKPVGAELFADPEGFMNELSDGELNNTKGGATNPTYGCTVVASCMCVQAELA
jgi:hypothetical protein